jgi:phosphoribosylaminoimidazole-succinocarboxamide synthase
MRQVLGEEVAAELRDRSIAIYRRGNEITRPRGIIIADTKLEWGWYDGRLILIDEVLTPDSSRFWPADRWQPGRSQASYDKQFLREFLDSTGWDKNSPPPELPETIIAQTRERYLAAYEQITGNPLLG